MYDCPELLPDEPFYVDAWQELCTERPATFGGMRAIPYSKIIEYARNHDYPEDMYDFFVGVIRGIDAGFFKRMEQKQENERRKQKQSAKLTRPTTKRQG